MISVVNLWSEPLAVCAVGKKTTYHPSVELVHTTAAVANSTVQSELLFRWMRVAHLIPVMIICTDMQRSHLRQETMEFGNFWVLYIFPFPIKH